MRRLIGQFLSGATAAVAIEYALLALLIALAVISSLVSVGSSLSGIFTQVGHNL